MVSNVNPNGARSLHYGSLIVKHITAEQVMRERIEQLEKQVDELKRQIGQMKRRYSKVAKDSRDVLGESSAYEMILIAMMFATQMGFQPYAEVLYEKDSEFKELKVKVFFDYQRGKGIHEEVFLEDAADWIKENTHKYLMDHPEYNVGDHIPDDIDMFGFSLDDNDDITL
jgi:ABC-type Fe3+-citrate transport system substrate-binding protein